LVLAAGDAVNFNYFANDGKVMIVAQNSGASPYTLTFTTQKTIDGLAIPDLTITITAGEFALVGRSPNLFTTRIIQMTKPWCTKMLSSLPLKMQP